MTGISNPATKRGYFNVATNDRSLSCSGPFNALDSTPTIIVPVTCSDGIYGRATVTRYADGVNGHGIVELSDGRVGRLSLGIRMTDD